MQSSTSETPRLRRPSWRDPRLLAGILLVVLSVIGVVMLVRSLDRSEGYWAAHAHLEPGTQVQPGDFQVVQAQLGEASAAYLPASNPAPEGMTVQGMVRAGELVPRAALVDADPEGRQAVSVALEDPLPVGTGVGDRVDIWVSTPAGQQGFEDPELVAPAAELVEVSQAEGAFGTSAQTVLQVMIAPADLPEILTAKADGSVISVVPTHGRG